MGNSILVDPTQALRNRQPQNDGTVDTLENELESVESQVPEKYKGKSVNDLITMHQEAEREKSRLGNEVGSLRRKTDDLERQFKAKEEKKNIKPVTVDDVLENPQEAIERVVNQSKVVREVHTKLDETETETLKQQFIGAHPTFTDQLSNPEFFEWVSKSQIRQALAQAADQLDYRAAKELWDLWQEREEIVNFRKETQKDEEARSKREKTLKKATLEGTSGTPVEAKKTFSRSEVRSLMTRAAQGDQEAARIVNSKKWQEERRRAYAEGRTVD